MKNNDILQALGLINNPKNMSMPNAKNMGLPMNMSIPKDPRYNTPSVYTDPSLMQEVREMLASEDYNNIPGLGNEDYNENSGLNEEISEYEKPNENDEHSIIDLLNQNKKPQEYSFEGGMEKALSKIKGIQNQLKSDSKEINTALNDEQRGIALRRGMNAAYQADAAKPWRSSGARGFINDLSGMMMQGLGGYDESRQQLQKENLEREKLRKALETQEAAIARAIEKELYSREIDKEDKRYKREYDKEKLDVEKQRYNSDLARMRAESMLRNSNTKKETLDLAKAKHEIDHPDFSKNNPSDFEIEDHGSYLGIEGVNVSRASPAGVTKINDNKNKVADGYKLMLDARKKIDDFYIKHNITEENDPRLNTLNRFKTVQAVKNFVGNLPGNPLGVNQEMWDDWKALIESTGQIAAEAERKIKGGILTTDILKLFADKGYITDFEKDYKGTFDKKFDVMTNKIGDIYKALEAASLYRANIDSINLMNILENKEKRLQKTKSEEKITKEEKEKITKEEKEKAAEENNNAKETEETDKKYNFK